MNKFTNFKNEKVTFIQADNVTNGILCDVYSFNNDTSKDLGVITVDPGQKTPIQKVIHGDKTTEGLFSGSGLLKIKHTDGKISQYEVNENLEKQEFKINIGEVMQWKAGSKGLVFYEICYPPCKEGRFENLSNWNN